MGEKSPTREMNKTDTGGLFRNVRSEVLSKKRKRNSAKNR